MFLYQSVNESPFSDLMKIDPVDADRVVLEINQLMKSGAITLSYNYLLNSLIDYNETSPISAHSDGDKSSIFELRLCRGDFSGCVIKLMNGGVHSKRSHFYVYPNDMFIYFIGDGDCDAILYEFESVENYEIFNSTRKHISSNEISLKGGDFLILKAGVHALQILNANNIVTFEVSSFKHHSIVWNFDTSSCQFTYPSSSDVSSTRIVMAMQVLSLIGDSESVNIIENTAENHHQHFVRWAAVEALSGLHEERLIGVLKKALSDPHPEIRNAAKKTLEFNGV